MNVDTAQTGPLLEVKNVKKAFGHVQALNGVSFTIQQASVVALLGDNPGFAVSNQKGESERFLALNTRDLRREKFG